ncbi:VanW family protein [Peptoniphilus catoniae]|uniref:VanW family protein n=1 Tax=Peptoniphilus catoniae TaxID=1660341 RepID=UPI0010FE56DD|nr:VanW family protein [Peptoniphilus catoniae]
MKKVIFKNKNFLSITILCLIIFISLGYYLGVKDSNTIHRGIKISGINVGKLTKKEAVKKVNQEKFQEIKDRSFDFKDGDMEYSFGYDDVGYKLDIEGAVEEAYSIGRSDSFFKNFIDIVKNPLINKNINLSSSLDDDKLNSVVENLALNVYKEPINAEIEYNKSSGFRLVSSQNGRYVDSNELKNLIINNKEDGEPIDIPIIVSYPDIKEEDFNGIDILYAEFSTDYSKSIENRKDNISLGAGHFNNLLIKPGEEISFNETVGDISEKTGFKNAAVIINGEFDQGIGGGICQVSTTLYNALIRSDLNIVERHNHTRPISYVPLGTDAAVAEGYKDLKFINSTNHNIYIKSFADGKDLTFQIFGNSNDKDYEVKIVPKLLNVSEPKTIEKYSKDMDEGESKVEKKGSKGYSYETYKEIIKDNEVVKTERISNSNYQAQDRVVIIGERHKEDKTDKKDSNKKNGNKKDSSKKESNKKDSNKKSDKSKSKSK